MTRFFTGALMVGAVLVGGWVGVAAFRRRVLDRAQVLALMALEAVVFAHAAASMVSLTRHDATEPGTHVAYALGSLVVLPLLVGVPVRLGFPQSPGAPGKDPQFVGGITVGPPPGAGENGAGQQGPGQDASPADRYRAAVAVLACVAILVMLERMWVTWQT